MTKPVIILGAGGHAKVLIDTLNALSVPIIGCTEIDIAKHGSDILGVPVMGNDEKVFAYATDQVSLVNGLGSTTVAEGRARLYESFKQRGYNFLKLIHPSAYVASHVELGEGVQIMAGATVQVSTTIGANTIINTKASVDHDCRIGSHVHVAPGVTISGNVAIGEGTHIGTAVTIIQNISIGHHCLLAAGALVTRDIPPCKGARGVPAQLWELVEKNTFEE